MNEKPRQINKKTSIRSLNEGDLGRAAELWLACFPEDDRAFVEYYFARRTCPERMLELFEGEGESENLVSMLCFEKRRMYAENPADPSEKHVGVLFVAGVCTDPAKRRRGYIRLLFRALEERMAEDGIGVFLLQPFDFAFYQKLGYVPFAKRGTVRVENRSAAPCGSFRPAEPTAEKMLSAYERTFAGRFGALERTAERFAAILEEYSLPGAKKAAVESETGCAYALWYGGDEPTADEFVYTDEAARAALEAEVFARAGAFSYPVPADGAQEGEAFFNMIRITDARYEYLLKRDRIPFGLTKY